MTSVGDGGDTSAVTITGPTPGSFVSRRQASFVRQRLKKSLIQLVEPAVEGLKLVEQVAEETPREIGKIGGRDGVLRLF